MLFLRFFLSVILFISLLFVQKHTFAQNSSFVSGKVKDAATNKALVSCSVNVLDTSVGSSTDKNGYFKLNLSRLLAKKDSIKVRFSHIGYFDEDIIFRKNNYKNIVVSLTPSTNLLKEVEIEGQEFGEQQLRETTMGSVTLKKEDFFDVPVLLGEVDVIKTMQLLPGTTKGVEGSTDYFVRGGDADQNLILMDGATVYNSGHLFGFMSVFNPDIIDKLTIIKGSFPVKYGTRLSSIVDLETSTKLFDDWSVVGNVGVIASRLAIKGPIVKDKLSITVAGRRTYIDTILKLVDDPKLQVPYYFYDFNGIINWSLTPRTRLSFSGYLSNDVLSYSRQVQERTRKNADGEEEVRGPVGFSSAFSLPSQTQSLRLRHIVNNDIKLNVNLTRTGFKYLTTTMISLSGQNSDVQVSNQLEDYSYKIELMQQTGDFDLSYGVEGVFHRFSAVDLQSGGLFEQFLPSERSRPLSSLENAVFFGVTKSLTPKLTATIGYRHSFSLSSRFNYQMPEPRASFRLKLGETDALKLGYSRNAQYVHRVSSSSISLPVDIWYTVTENIKPQSADQISFGYVKVFAKPKLLLETELYYKNFNNVTEFANGVNILFNTEFEKSVIQGVGESYGWEFLLRKKGDRFRGWVSYTLSRTDRQFDAINDGRVFPAKYDRRHNVSVVGIAQLHPRLKVSFVWEYLSGARFTALLGQYATVNATTLDLNFQSIFSERNGVKLSDSHRLDISIAWRNKLSKKISGEWQLSLYNVYNQTTPVSVSISTKDDGFKYEQIGIFGFLPSIAYQFKF